VTSPETMANPKRGGPPGRLQTRIGIALGGLIVGMCVVLSLLMGEIGERRLVRLSAANLEVLTSQMARELSAGMYQFAKEVVNQAYRDRYRDPAATAASMRSALDDFQRENPEVAHASIIDAATGKVIAATSGVFEGRSAAGRPVYEMGQKGLFYGDVHGAVRLAELLPHSPTGEPLRFLDVAAPIRDPEGRVTRVFAVHIGWEWTGQIRDNVLGPVARRQDVELFLIDTASKVVLTASPDIPVGTDLSGMGLQPDQRPVKKTWSDGSDYLTAMAVTEPRGSFAGFGWRVVARQPYALTVASVRSLQYGFLAGGLAIGLVAALLAWQVTGRLVGPLRRLADQADGMNSGQPWPNTAMAAEDPADETGEVLAVKRALSRLAQSARLSADASKTQARQFEALAASLQQVVWQADRQGRLEYVNHDWIRAQKPDGDFFVADLESLIHEDDRAAFAAQWALKRESGADLSCRCRLRHQPDGAARWFEVQARAVRGADGGIERWVGTLFDVDDITKLAEATRRALEEEQAARLQADRSARIRDEFLATVSHELRSPLNAITGWSDILSRKRTDDPMIIKATQSIRRNARHQAALIDDLMDMTSVMAGKMILRFERLDLSQVARSVFLSHLPAAQEQGVDLVCREGHGLVVNGESRRLEQVLSNLVGNAIKFTDAGGRVEISVENVKTGDTEKVRLTVNDTGRGISAAFLPHVFDRMRQEDGSVTRRVGGLGLGLAIARGVVELHGGTIEAASGGAGQGAVFTVTLDRADDRAAAPPSDPELLPADELGHDLEGLRVLLVDDEADAREVAHVALAAFGLVVRPVASAAEALLCLESERFDLLVSDIGMPVMDGLSFMRKVRESGGAWHSIPAVALTAFAMETDIRAGLDAGFHAYVAKPISLQRLYSAAIKSMDIAKQLT
jgi:signal transduction histidine kinase/ActR/RegA family two-component response regulator/HAMP domain-containing protein